MRGPIHNWASSQTTLRIAEVLVAGSGAEPLRPDEISQRLGDVTPGAARDTLRRLHEGDLVSRAKISTGRRGRPAWRYSLSDHQLLAAQPYANPGEDSPETGAATSISGTSPVDTDEGPALPHPASSAGADASQNPGASVGQLQRGQELVVVDVTGTQLAEVMDALCHTASAHRARWVALFGDELVFAFDDPDPIEPAADLLAVFAGARVTGRRATVTAVAPVERLIAQALRASPATRRARMTRDARDALQ